MANFKLTSKFSPGGDQPGAIRKLTDGFKAGAGYQTLLGVTGSGKSLHPNEDIWLYKKVNGKLIPKLISIGSFVDEILQKQNLSKIQHSTQVDFLSPEFGRYYAFSINPKTLKSEIKPITAVHRHRSPRNLWTVKTACGRSVCITGDHNLWVLRNGRLELLKTQEVKTGDYLPVMLSLPFNHAALRFVSIMDTLRKDKSFYVNCRKEYLNLSGMEMWRLGKIIRPKNQQSGYAKLWRVVKQGERLSLSDAKALEYHGLDLGLKSCAIRSNKKGYEMPLTMPVTHDFLELIGYFLAEGHAEDRYFIISCAEREIQLRLERCLENVGFNWKIRSNGYDYVIYSSLYARLFAQWCGATSRKKHLPPFWANLNNGQLSLLLSTYFAGDGGVEHDEVTATTASRQLSSEISYALMRFGIWSRIAQRFKRATNSSHKGDIYYRLSVSGSDQLRIFADNIAFSCERKIGQLNNIIGKHSNTNVDIIPICGNDIKKLRIALHWHQKTLAGYTGCARSMISLIESGKRRPSRKLFAKFLKIFEYAIKNKNQPDLIDAVSRIKKLSSVRWTPIHSISKQISDTSWVYDLSVMDNETFLAGYGGLFVHNTFTMANVIANIGRPALVISHNKTLAAQLYSEFKEFFPENAVEYFVSYYDYYQPEAYIPHTDIYIEKDSSINEDIDRLRLSATSSLQSRDDCIVVASVSCIYGLGSPGEYGEMMIFLEEGEAISRDAILKKLTTIHYERNDYDFKRSTFRVRGDTVEIFPAYTKTAYRIEQFGDKIERIYEIDPLTGGKLNNVRRIAVYPAKHFVTTPDRIEAAIVLIERELAARLAQLRSQNKLVEAQRLESRTHYDIEMMREAGYCGGIENYSAHLSKRGPGTRPWCLIDYFPKGFITFIDESHVTIPQVRGMYNGDRARKQTLIDYGFRLPSALDNRPLKFEEFESLVGPVTFVSATPDEYEMAKSKGRVVEQLIRPTGLIDPPIEVKPTEGQIDDLIKEISERAKKRERVLVTTLTKRLAEDLARYLSGEGLKVKYLHSEMDAIERVEVLRDLRLNKFDCLVGINLLREGLDLPEVSLVAILDADKEGFLRSQTSLIQVAGRAARHINGRVIMYADTLTKSMKRAIDESKRRRETQIEFNKVNKITPRSIEKAVKEGIESYKKAREVIVGVVKETDDQYDITALIGELQHDMESAARNLQFEKAALLRDQIKELKEKLRGGTKNNLSS